VRDLVPRIEDRVRRRAVRSVRADAEAAAIGKRALF
jgi:hypothetical protein